MRRTFFMITGILKYLACFLDFLTANNRDYLISKEISYPMRNHKTLIYAFWTKTGLPEKSDEIFIEMAKRSDFDVLAVINCDQFHDLMEIKFAWERLGINLVLRRNKGRDLAAYRCGLAVLRNENIEIETIFLSNNSIYWLPSTLENFFQKVDSRTESLFGLTNSYQPTWHLQSFGIVAKKNEISNLELSLSRIGNYKLKRSAVIFGEIRLSRLLLQDNTNHFPAIFDYSKLIQKAEAREHKVDSNSFQMFRYRTINDCQTFGRALNPTHHLWLELYESGFPGVKKDLISKNPSNINDLISGFKFMPALDQDFLELSEVTYLFKPKSLILKLRKRVGA